MSQAGPTGMMRRFPHGEGPANHGLVLLYADEWPTLPAAWTLPKNRPTRIGREGDVDVLLNVAAVSRSHAHITPRNGRFHIADNGSTNGTLYDGVLLDAEEELEPDAELRIGDALLKFVEEPEAYASYRIDGSMIGGAKRRASPGTALVGGWKMDCIASELERIAPAELSVLLLGESGTGKEVAATELHAKSGRRGLFSAVNCAAIPATLLESELFGYKRGAFSGAERDRPGLIRTAHEGTLLLDEIGDMPLDAQAKLLRVLQSKEVVPLGASTPERVDVRIVCATHRDLAALQRDGKFRADLFARLNEHQLRLPPLRDRKEDVLMLVRTFLSRHGRPDVEPSFHYMMGLLHYDWPYNVRELEACIKRSLALCEGKTLLREHLPEAVTEALKHYGQSAQPPSRGAPEGAPPPPQGQRSAPSRDELVELLTLHKGNVAAVGREFGKARQQVHRWMSAYGIEVAEFREKE